jgi:2-amino-4-hydroxy-6-hydroxymethyldihydropteridine diphosphokinase
MNATPRQPVRAHLALGSNVGDPIASLRAAAEAIGRLASTRIAARSRIYRTPPWGKTDQDPFANAALAIDTQLEPLALLEACLAIETELGRVRRERWGPRVIDIDVLAYGDTRRTGGRLTLPHPAMAERAFVLVPLKDVAPGFELDGVPIDRLLARLDTSGIEPIAAF